jgi:squalene-hopene/tetraprenyl-beta-curcumene cyclase
MEGQTMNSHDAHPKSDSDGAAHRSTARDAAIQTLCDRLFASISPDGFWEGRLSSSALSTATAVSAMSLARADDDAPRIRSGIAWLAAHHNADGGWGDTADSPSNLATTLLAIAALRLAAAAGVAPPIDVMQRADRYLAEHVMKTSSGDLGQAIRNAYGDDRTFAVPILMNCALAELVGWSEIPGLPFELAVLPHRWYKVLRLHVVSYALPALIAIGLAVNHRHPPRSALYQAIRRMATPRVLRKLGNIQPDHGGFLDATPLTSFVAMGLIPLFGRDQPVAAKCLRFLRQAQRSDGSWPIDTNLSVWLTTSAVTALAAAEQLSRLDQTQTARWIACRQYTATHPFTGAAPGGWPWTHLAGGVPDADDTAGAIIALGELGQCGRQYRDQIDAGMQWLLDLQNSDGGWPTFCRGWGKLPFDRSAPDLTAHVLRALKNAATARCPDSMRRAIGRGLEYLRHVQQADGSWIPLWFGNQRAPGQNNPVVGTSLVLRALELADGSGLAAARGVEYLCNVQNADGGWGGAAGIASSLEETALAVAAIAPWSHLPRPRESFLRGLNFLMERVDQIRESRVEPVAVGLYFSRLWYSETLYPLIWTIEAVGRAKQFDVDGPT